MPNFSSFLVSRPSKRRRVDLNTKFSRMIDTMKAMSSSGPSQEAPSHGKVSSSAANVFGAFGGSDEGRLGREFSLIKMRPEIPLSAHDQCITEPSTESNLSRHKEPLPFWLQSTISQLVAHHPLRVILPPNRLVSAPEGQNHVDHDSAVIGEAISHMSEDRAISLGKGEQCITNFLPLPLVQNHESAEARTCAAAEGPIFAPPVPLSFLPTQRFASPVPEHIPHFLNRSSLMSRNSPTTEHFRTPDASFLEEIATVLPPFSTPGPLFHPTASRKGSLECHAKDNSSMMQPPLLNKYHYDDDFSPVQQSPSPPALLSRSKIITNTYSSDDDLATETSSSLLTDPSLFGTHINASVPLLQDNVSSRLSPSSRLAAQIDTGSAIRPIRVYFDSPLEDPTSSDPMEHDEYELFRPDPEKFGFRWKPFDRKNICTTDFFRCVKDLDRLEAEVDFGLKEIDDAGGSTFLDNAWTEETQEVVNEDSWNGEIPLLRQRDNEFVYSEEDEPALAPAAIDCNLFSGEVLPSTPKRHVVVSVYTHAIVDNLT
jgi:hypothetical protein